MNWNLSGFADEISPDLGEQIEVLARLGVTGLDLRSAFGKNVMGLSDEEAKDVRARCEDAGLHVQAIGSPIGKDASASIERAAELAHLAGTRRIRFFVPKGTDDEAARFVEERLAVAEREDVLLLLENDTDLYCAHPASCRKLYDRFPSAHLVAAFDFANSVLDGYAPSDWFLWLTPRLDTLHIKDAVAATRTVVPAGEGDGAIETTLRTLVAGGWRGPLTLEPHLAHAGSAGGFSGAELFERATTALKGILTRI